jgi:hypothetical protein
MVRPVHVVGETFGAQRAPERAVADTVPLSVNTSTGAAFMTLSVCEAHQCLCLS